MGTSRVASPGRPRRRLLLVPAVAVPLAVCWVLAAAGRPLSTADSALVVVVVVVAAACTGFRLVGYVAATSAAICFDFFLTPPYRSLAIDSQNVVTFVILLIVSAIVTELAQLSRRVQLRAAAQARYVDSMVVLSGRPADGLTADGVRETIRRQLVTLLDLDDCTWVRSIDPRAPRLGRDGGVYSNGDRLPDDDELPTNSLVMLPLHDGDPHSPGFALNAASHLSRPTLRQRRLAGSLAEQFGHVLESPEWMAARGGAPTG